MSHFCSLVICTPKYLETHDLIDSLDKYDENREVPEYIDHEVDDFEKTDFLAYYAEKDEILNREELEQEFVNLHKGEEGYKTLEEVEDEWGKCDEKRYAYFIIKEHHDEYIEFFKSKYPDLFNDFDKEYEENGNDWNGSRWRINPETNKWCDYSTYNPYSKWDWYALGNRWSGSIKTKSGEYTDECLLGEIDWSPFKPEDYCKKWEKNWRGDKYHPLKKNVKWHYNSEEVPFAVIIDGEWHEKGEMGWWCAVSNEKENWNTEFMNLIKDLDPNSQVFNIDFHI